MAFEDLREQLKDRANEALAKIQESSAYNTLRERYESQTPAGQKLITAGGIGLLALFIFLIPYSYISSGSDSLITFDENRELIQGLLRASRSASEPPPLPPPMSADTLRSSIERMVREQGLLPDQTSPIENVPPDVNKGFAPSGVLHTAVAVPLKKLNLTQVIEIGNYLQNGLGPGTKLMGIDIVQSAGQTHYYDMILQVVSFGIPSLGGGDDDAATGAAPKGRPRGGTSPKPADEEGFE